MLTDWDYTKVQWFDNLESIWEEVDESFDPDKFVHYGEELTRQLGLPMCAYTKAQSKFFKSHYMSNWRNVGCTIKEIDVIRKAEGW